MEQTLGDYAFLACPADRGFFRDLNRRPLPDTPRTFRQCVKATVVALGVAVLIALNVLSVALPSVLRHQARCDSAKYRKLVAPLCVPCEHRGGPDDASLVFEDSEAGSTVCCATSYTSLVAMVDTIYSDVLREKTTNRYTAPPEEELYFEIDGPSDDVSELIFLTNSIKPLAHLTGLRAESSAGDKRDEQASLQVVTTGASFEPYKTVTGGEIKRRTWGLEVSTNGTYRLYSFVNFYFQTPSPSKSADDRTEVTTAPVIHQLTHFDVIGRREEVLVQRNQTVSSRHFEGLASFLMTSARLTVGDVILVRVSHPRALGMQERWHTEGLVLVQ